MGVQIGVDTGGTHTDVALIDGDGSALHTLKVPTTPENLTRGVLSGVRQLLENTGHEFRDIEKFVYGTTLVTNILIEQEVTDVGFLTTRNFRDVLEIGRAWRDNIEAVYDIRWRPRPALIPRHLRYGIGERIGADGSIIEHLDEETVRSALASLQRQGVDTIAVCLLNAYANPVHELRIAEIAAIDFPQLAITISSDIVREFREYERGSTTAINALVMKPLNRHLDQLAAETASAGFKGAPFIMQSNGGLATFESAKTRPVTLTHSGPMGGIVATAALGAACGIKDLVGFDMGGTSTDVSMIVNGAPVTRSQARIADHPVLLASLELVTIGAGGGSLAWIDKGGLLKVGPESAGSVPGPACYGTGGRTPTITDANLVAGRLNEDYFLAGARPLFADKAVTALKSVIGERLGMGPVQAALGVIAIAETHMVNAIKELSVKRGVDPREMVLTAFGGAGALHAASVADALSMSHVIVPPAPGNMTAVGMLGASVRRDFAQSVFLSLTSADAGEQVDQIALGLADEGNEALGEAGVDDRHRQVLTGLDLRYEGQSFDLPVPLVRHADGTPDIPTIALSFHRAFEKAYGYCLPDGVIEIVNIRTTAIGSVAVAQPLQPARDSNHQGGPTEERRVFWRDDHGVMCPIYRWSALTQSSKISGPAIVEFSGSTAIVPAGWSGRLDRLGNIHLMRRGT